MVPSPETWPNGPEADQERRAAPRVKPKTVVRFSQKEEVYDVEFDGTSAAGMYGVPEDEGETDGGPAGRVPRMAGLPRLQTPLTFAVKEVAAAAPASAEKEVECATRSRSKGGALGAAEESAGDLFEGGTPYPTGWSKSLFVRAWGVLTGWLSELALASLRGSPLVRTAELCASDLSRHRVGRRALLRDLLLQRVQGDLSFLAMRLSELCGWLSVHQSLPCASEVLLYDLLALLLLRGLYSADVARGAVRADAHVEAVLREQLTRVTAAGGVNAQELETLVRMVETPRALGP